MTLELYQVRLTETMSNKDCQKIQPQLKNEESVIKKIIYCIIITFVLCGRLFLWCMKLVEYNGIYCCDMCILYPSTDKWNHTERRFSICYIVTKLASVNLPHWRITFFRSNPLLYQQIESSVWYRKSILHYIFICSPVLLRLFY